MANVDMDRFGLDEQHVPSAHQQFLKEYSAAWKSNATSDNVNSLKSFPDLVSVVNSRRDLESAKSMDDILNLLMQRRILHEYRERQLNAEERGVELLKRMVCWAHVRDPTMPVWLVPNLLNFIEAREMVLQSIGSSMGGRPISSLKPMALPYDGSVTVFRIIPPAFNETALKRVFLEVYKQWRDVVASLPGMKMIDILHARRKRSHPVHDRTSNNEDVVLDFESDFLMCVAWWIREYPQNATWRNFVKTVACTVPKSARFVRDLRPPV